MSDFTPNNYNKPFPPSKPTEPKFPSPPNASIDILETETIASLYNNDDFEISLSDLIKKMEELNNFSDVKLKIACESDFYGGGENVSAYISYIKKNADNPDFNKEMKKYEKAKKKYDKEYIEYKKSLDNYKLEFTKYEEELKIWNEFERKRDIKRLEKKLASMKKDEEKLAKLKQEVK